MKKMKLNLRKGICQFLLNTLPNSYKEEAKYCFYIETNTQTIPEAFQYALGGIEYRIRKFIFGFSNYLER